MALTLNKFIVPDGAPGGGSQATQSSSWGDMSGVLTNGTINFPAIDGGAGDVITTDGSGNLSLSPAPRTNGFITNAQSETVAPPADKSIRWNSSNQELANLLFVDYNTDSGKDVKNLYNALVQPGAQIVLQDSDDTTHFQIFNVLANTDQTTYAQTTVFLSSSSGDGNFAATTKIVFTLLDGSSHAARIATENSTASLDVQNIANRIYKCDASAGAFTLTLPSTLLATGLTYTFKKIDSTANSITIDGNGAFIDANLTESLDSQYDSISIVSDGVNWLIV